LDISEYFPLNIKRLSISIHPYPYSPSIVNLFLVVG